MAQTFGRTTLAYRHNSNRALLSLGALFSLVSAILGVVLLYPQPKLTTTQVPTPSSETLPMVTVLIPKVDIQPNQLLEPSLFELQSRPTNFTSKRIMRDFEQVKGMFARALIVAGEPVHAAYVSEKRGSNPISPLIPSGYRAVTIPVSDMSSVDGMVRPGEVVDISWHYTSRGKAITKLTVERAQVIGADKQVEGTWRPGMKAPGTVTLLVPSKDSLMIQFMEKNGTMSLALRNPEDTEPQSMEPINADSLVGEQQLLPVKNACNGTVTMRGPNAEKVDYCFNGQGSLVFKEGQ